MLIDSEDVLGLNRAFVHSGTRNRTIGRGGGRLVTAHYSLCLLQEPSPYETPTGLFEPVVRQPS